MDMDWPNGYGLDQWIKVFSFRTGYFALDDQYLSCLALSCVVSFCPSMFFIKQPKLAMTRYVIPLLSSLCHHYVQDSNYLTYIRTYAYELNAPCFFITILSDHVNNSSLSQAISTTWYNYIPSSMYKTCCMIINKYRHTSCLIVYFYFFFPDIK